MRRLCLVSIIAIAASTSAGLAQQPMTGGPYKVLQTAKVGGEGGTDYIYADVVGRRLYIPRGGTRAIPATATSPEVAAVAGRITVFNLDTLAPTGEIPDTGGNGVAVDPKSGHGFSSSKPVSMFDTRTLKVIKKIDVGAAQPDGIYFDAFNDHLYVFSHPTKDATVIDTKTGAVLGTIDLGGTPEQAVADGKGTLYVVMQDNPGGVAVVDVKTMKTTAHYPFGDKGGCNGLALDVKNRVLFAACGRSGAPPQPGQPSAPAQPMMVMLSAVDGKIFTSLPLAGSSDGAVFIAATMEAVSSHGNGTMTIVKEKTPTTFEVEQDLQTNAGRTLTLDTKTNHIFSMASERGPAPVPATPPAPGGRAAQGAVIPGSFTIFVVGR